MTNTSLKSAKQSNKVTGYVDLVAVQDQKLMEQQSNKIEFLRSIQPPGTQTCFGKKTKAREEEDSMNEIFSWGYEAPVKEDYTKNKAEISNKIRKMKRTHISESHDNYRKPEGPVARDLNLKQIKGKADSKAETESKQLKTINDVYLFNYFDLEEIELFKKKLFEKATDEERELRNQTMYREFFSKNFKDNNAVNAELRAHLEEIKGWTPAGKPSGQPYDKFGEIQRPIVSPVDLKWLQLEAKLREIGFTAETVAAAAAAYEEERQKTLESKSQSKYNQDVMNMYDQQGLVQIDEEGAARQRAKSAALKRLQDKDLQKRMDALKLEGRLLPDSALTTYFGKPAWHAYGNGNTRPTNGGLMYGSYLKTHNINPHSGANKPDHIQVYQQAMNYPAGFVNVKASRSKSPKKQEDLQPKTQKDRFTRKPQPPRVPVAKRPITAQMLKTSDKQFPVEPEDLYKKDNRPIKKPTLRPDPNLHHQVKDNAKVKKTNQQSGTTLNIGKQASASRRSALQGKDQLASTRNSVALGESARANLRFDEDVKQDMSEMGDKNSLIGRENQENTNANFDQSEFQETLATEKDRGPKITSKITDQDRAQRKTMTSSIGDQMNIPLDEFIRALQASAPGTSSAMIGPRAPESLDLLNPANYKYLHPKYLKNVKNAGQPTPASIHVKDLNGFTIAAAK